MIFAQIGHTTRKSAKQFANPLGWSLIAALRQTQVSLQCEPDDLGCFEAAIATRPIERVTKVFWNSHGQLGIHAVQCNALQCKPQASTFAGN